MTTNTTHHAPRTAGFSLVEMIVYIAILTIVVSSLVLSSVSLLRTFAYMSAAEDVSEAATVTLERLTRELRFANSVDVGASTLGVHPGTLVLNTVDAADNPTTATITLTGGRVTFAEGAAAPSPLTRSSITVSQLTFTHVVGAETEAVRVEMTLQRQVNTNTITKQYRTFVVLDAS